ncbi:MULTISPECIES: DUF2164 domain-containing protein [Thalassotalea]|uniref:DUF2164 domain-containing protein n=1 Tax=Thalassotalea castellviae TaxID=3075612 RepID=A0ABU2ZZW8_9GAMM|nr:DUF2164 domain-containing protein [Thalassotalea sp. W431]MDT0603476.1 DUF2164 domain-containing protein [Thalassotalea sp. W431]
MSEIKFSPQEKAQLVDKLQRYFDRELEQELGQFDAEFLLDFVSKEFGSFYYNRGLYDAQHIISDRVEQISEAIYELEKPVN